MTDFLLRISAPLLLASAVSVAAYSAVAPVVAQARQAVEERVARSVDGE